MKDEEANISTETKVRNKSFCFDTPCTSDMTSYAGRLLNYSKCTRYLKSSSQASMEIVGKGDMIMECVVRDGSGSSFRVCNVSHVAKIGHHLISWGKLSTKGHSEFGEEDCISIYNRIKVMFEVVFDGYLFKIPEISHLAQISYDFSHAALCNGSHD